ncbi:MAG: hypothetical protein JSW35_05790, partial [Deltaproteobacteria bacterium]
FLRGHCLRGIFLCFVPLLLLLVSNPGIGFAKSPSKDFIRSRLVRIDGKTNSALILKERHFTVTESTTMVAVNGKKIQLSDLPVPCEAEVTYRLSMDQDPEALKVMVKKVFPHSSTIWSPQEHD